MRIIIYFLAIFFLILFLTSCSTKEQHRKDYALRYVGSSKIISLTLHEEYKVGDTLYLNALKDILTYRTIYSQDAVIIRCYDCPTLKTK